MVGGRELGCGRLTEILWIEPAAALVLGYLLGSIPFGLLLTALVGGGDIRTVGSGNIGATNVLRSGRKWLAALTLILDAAKGAVAVLIAREVSPDLVVLAAAGAFFGHLYPVWLRFKGGKGVATLLGITLAIHWPCGVVFIATWLTVFALLRYSSVAGIAAAVVTPVSAAFWGEFELVMLFIAFALMVLWKHRANIERLLAGTEPRFGRSQGG